MITKFKTYEKLNFDQPKIGDYILIFSQFGYFEKYNNKIGRIIDIEKNAPNYKKILFYVNFYVNNIKVREPIYGYEIVYWSDKKDELQKIIDTQKYNL